MKILIILIILFTSTASFAHGEDQLGPHKGFILMPGAFHTEIVPEGDNAFKFYLLDMNWKNPSVKNSKIGIKIKHNKKVADVVCSQEADFFQCRLPKNFSLKKGKLFVIAVREGLTGTEVTYNLPLKIKTKSLHGGHH